MLNGPTLSKHSTEVDNLMALEKHCAGDLFDFNKKLVEPGWAGELNVKEFIYIKDQLKQSRTLRMRWGFRPSAKRFSDSHIRAVARDGLTAIHKPVLASAVKDKN